MPTGFASNQTGSSASQTEDSFCRVRNEMQKLRARKRPRPVSLEQRQDAHLLAESIELVVESADVLFLVDTNPVRAA